MVTRVSLLIWLVALLLPGVAQAQLSCTNPPPPFDDEGTLRRWQSVWDLTDICLGVEGVFDQILSGGVGRDGIPPIDTPVFDTLAVADEWLQDASPVIAVEVGGLARAYPLAILTRHEIVNDRLGGEPIAVTFCPLCNSAVVFHREVGGDTLRFGVSGLLRNSDLVMWDDLTQSLWQQLTGEGIVGSYTGTLLDLVPSQLVGYAAFKQQYPAGEVLSPGSRQYGRNPYVGYDSNPRPFLFRGELDTRLRPTERVLGTVQDGIAVAYPFEILARDIVLNDSIGERDAAAFWQPGTYSALDDSLIDRSVDVGMAALFSREWNGQLLTFQAQAGRIVDEQTGSEWSIFGRAIAGELAGAELQPLHAFPHFWFAWAAFYPQTTVYGS